ncbi:glycoside hydrolase family 68 protein [Pseudoroseicyclus tamaricis]|uniref:Glycosyl hydrolase family 32 n=1 Tax=Pseudoroseicyclus tamaricis TaxID=2705421 RepID=A0A6B2JPD0_9RHOB|nr:glycoside hydrolase family 68 protein [Pseudoroseicyclus tamaricis]NDU99849.1 glycosyl hydrolase family 32 [Pseudoroseicyclus tamaricis]
MGFDKADHWVWDMWFADDGDLFHMFYLHAPRSVGHPDLRHRNARIGHATSADLRDWQDHGRIFDAGAPEDFDATCTWTGSVIRGDDGLWHLFYTGTRFTDPADASHHENVETIGHAVSEDLHAWVKRPGPVCTADPRWYETLGSSSWPEEAWRDPWVYRDGFGPWNMLITGRANDGPDDDRGVIALATSDDLHSWQVQPPLSAPGAGFGHLEVFQIVEVEGHRFLIFSCDTAKLGGARTGETGGIWAVAERDGSWPVAEASLIVNQDLYAGRVVIDRAGKAQLMGFDNRGGVEFKGGIADPRPLTVDTSGALPRLTLENAA